MLILTRKINESIVIGDDVVVTVLPSKNANQVKLGIEAPKNVIVDRSEVGERREIDRELVPGG